MYNSILSKDEFGKDLNKKIFEIPLVLADSRLRLYFLINDLDVSLEEFILSGMSDSVEFHVFPEDQEQEMIRLWRKLGLICTYHSQQIEYMYRLVTITYLRIHDPTTGASISLLPWFLLPGRPFPVFVYVYAICHYYSTGKKSLSVSAAAARKMFGIKGFNKSTLSRNIKAMGNFIDISQIDRPLSVDWREALSDEEKIDRIPEILGDTPSIENLEEIFGEKVKHLPEPVNRAKEIEHTLSGIPEKYSKITIDRAPDCGKPRDDRKRPTRSRGKTVRVQRRPEFVGSQQIEKIRIAFFEICRSLVLDAAGTYHRFLL
jgi:hypothetical protein